MVEHCRKGAHQQHGTESIMSSLLLSQSIISSTENSLRESRLHQQHGHHGHHHLHPGYPHHLLIHHQQTEARRRMQDFSKFCRLVFFSLLFLIFYLSVFALIASMCYLLIFWIPKDIQRNNQNTELYHSITNSSNILLVAHLPQHGQKYLLTKDLFLFETDIKNDFMTYDATPVALQAKWPALFWNEDFRSMVTERQCRGAIWLDASGQMVLVFMAPANETTERVLRFEPAINHIRLEVHSTGPEAEMMTVPISSARPGVEIKLEMSRQNQTIRLLMNDVQKDLDLRNLLTNRTETIMVGFGNGTHLHLIAGDQVLVGVAGQRFEAIPIERFLENHLTPAWADYILFGLAGISLFVLIVFTVKCYIVKRHASEDESRPLFTMAPAHHLQPIKQETWLGKMTRMMMCNRKTPGTQTPGIHTPGIHTPGIHTPGSHTPGTHTPTRRHRKNYVEV